MGPTFSTILNEFWTDFLQFSAKYGGCHIPLMCAPEGEGKNYAYATPPIPLSPTVALAVWGGGGLCKYVQTLRDSNDFTRQQTLSD